jgi:para-aminobenzoate synthetase/4-amino-4-deoxychorismate lyase
VSDLLWPDPAIGVFETLLIVDGSPIELQAHLERIGQSVRELFGVKLPEGTRELALEHASPLPLGRLRLTVAPSLDGVLGADVVTATVDSESVFPSWERSIALSPFVVHGGIGAHKWADRTGLEWARSLESEGHLPLVLDAGREVLEASRANVFAVEHEVLITPAADGRILPGVTRARVIETAHSLGIELREESLGLDRLIAAGEAFLTGSVRGVEPVRSVGESELRGCGDVVAGVVAELKKIWIGEDALNG